MSSTKVTTGALLFAKTEASYAAGASFNSTDVVVVEDSDSLVFETSFANDGDRGGASWSAGNLIGSPPSGQTSTAQIKIAAKGLGAAYSLSAFPPMHSFLLASGLTGSLSGSGWLYTPRPVGTSTTSMALQVVGRGEILFVSGTYCNMGFSTEGAGATVFTYDAMGIPSDVVDIVSVPSYTFTANSVLAPKNTSVALTITSGSTAYSSGKIRSYTYAHNLEIAPRLNINTSQGHSGYTLGRRKPTYTLLMEADALANFDPYIGMRDGTLYSLSLTVGTQQYNRFRFTFPQCQIRKVSRQNDGPSAMWEMELVPSVTSPGVSDDLQIYFF